MGVARKLAVASLPVDTFADASISPFAQGAFHRLYRLTSQLTTAEYLMRVALPVDPFFKTESEVATMDFVRRHSSIPVPQVVTYSSSASNELGFEWILMERVDGEPLDTIWDKMPFQAKMDLTAELARSLKQLWERPFPLLGSIYYADLWNQVDYAPPLGPAGGAEQHPADFGMNGAFVIGRMVSTRFFRDKRLLLRPDRGPFATARELATAETELLARRVRHLSPSPTDPYYCEVDSMLADDGDDVLDTADRLVQVLPRVFPTDDSPEDAKLLWHGDMSLMNVLVDSETYKLAGVVDWESASVVPAWEIGGGVGDFLRGISVEEPLLPGTVSAEEEDGLVEIRKDWELVLLRREFSKMLGLASETALVTNAAFALKVGLSVVLSDFEDRRAVLVTQGIWDRRSQDRRRQDRRAYCR